MTQVALEIHTAVSCNYIVEKSTKNYRRAELSRPSVINGLSDLREHYFSVGDLVW